MSRFAWFCAAVVLVGCGAQETAGGDGSRVARYGISLRVPDGWYGRITRGAVRLATVAPGTKLGADDVAVVLFEYEPAPPDTAAGAAQTFDGRWPPSFAAEDLADPDVGGRIDDANAPGRRAVAVHGRFFNVFLDAGSRPVSERRVGELNEALAGIEVEAGDFYRGRVRPVEFPARAGWHVVSSGPRPRYAHGEYVQTAAATVPYRNDPADLPPARTLEALPEDGMLLWVSLTRDARVPPTWDRGAFEPRALPPHHVGDLERVYPWEGQVRDISEYRLWASVGAQYDVDLRIYFGRSYPTESMRAEADAALRSLRFPDWGPWELDDEG